MMAITGRDGMGGKGWNGKGWDGWEGREWVARDGMGPDDKDERSFLATKTNLVIKSQISKTCLLFKQHFRCRNPCEQ